MSQETVQLVRESFLATGSGDPAAAQAVRARFFDRSIEWDMSGLVGWTEKHVYRGQEVGEFLQAWADSWREWHFELEEVRDAGESTYSPPSTSGESALIVGQALISAAISQSRYVEPGPCACRCSVRLPTHS